MGSGHFSHIFIDEASQAMEPETLVALDLAGKWTSVVLAGPSVRPSALGTLHVHCALRHHALPTSALILDYLLVPKPT